VREAFGIGPTVNEHVKRHLAWKPGAFEAGEGARTLDIQLGRLTLYQLSYTRKSLLIEQRSGNLAGISGFVSSSRSSLGSFASTRFHQSSHTPSRELRAENHHLASRHGRE
tara:strand:- start:57 stop:389 length:333 start_codon:yes stop_codon:yes gene_type:complete